MYEYHLTINWRFSIHLKSYVFPGYEQEKYIPAELQNVTLTILEGLVVFEPEVPKRQIGQSFKLTKGNRMHVLSGTFHKVLNIGDNPAFYMYTFFNGTEVLEQDSNLSKTKLPIFRELFTRLANMIMFGKLVTSNIIQLFKSPHCSSVF